MLKTGKPALSKLAEDFQNVQSVHKNCGPLIAVRSHIRMSLSADYA